METTNPTVGDTPGLEIALLRRSLGQRHGQAERCGACERAMLIGERVYEYESGEVRCELCRDRSDSSAVQTHTVHTPAFGHSIRVLDRRRSRTAA